MAETAALSPGLASHLTIWAIAQGLVPKRATPGLLFALDGEQFLLAYLWTRFVSGVQVDVCVSS